MFLHSLLFLKEGVSSFFVGLRVVCQEVFLIVLFCLIFLNGDRYTHDRRVVMVRAGVRTRLLAYASPFVVCTATDTAG